MRVFAAEITFSKRGDAKRALDKYNGVHLDGAKMKIQFVQGQSISERVVLPQRPQQVGLLQVRLSDHCTFELASYLISVIMAS